jgi:hypothetical protein
MRRSFASRPRAAQGWHLARLIVGLNARKLRPVHEWTGGFAQFWNESFDRLDAYVQDLKQPSQRASRRARGARKEK